jgi:methionine synthase II (cobalamin-independent)
MLPTAQLVIMLDEPSLPAVHRGQVPFSSGYRRHWSVPEDQLVAGLRWSRDAARQAGALAGLHSCAAQLWPVVQRLQPDVLSLDATLLTPEEVDPLGGWLESGGATVWGVWPTTAPRRDEAERCSSLVAGWLSRVGLPPNALPGASAVSPRCGLAGTTAPMAQQAMRGVREVAKRLSEAQ